MQYRTKRRRAAGRRKTRPARLRALWAARALSRATALMRQVYGSISREQLVYDRPLLAPDSNFYFPTRSR